jgi:hypothetical protein
MQREPLDERRQRRAPPLLPRLHAAALAPLVVLVPGHFVFHAVRKEEGARSTGALVIAPGHRWLLSLPLVHVGGLGIVVRARCCGRAPRHRGRRSDGVVVFAPGGLADRGDISDVR